jgi:hypothetical protein
MVAFKSVPGSNISKLFPSFSLPDGTETHFYQKNGPFEQRAAAIHNPPATPRSLKVSRIQVQLISPRFLLVQSLTCACHFPHLVRIHKDLLLDELPHAPLPPSMHLSTRAHVSCAPDQILPDGHLLPIEEEDRLQRWGRLSDDGQLVFAINPFPEKKPPPTPPQRIVTPPRPKTPWVFTRDTLVWKGRCKKAESWSKDFWVGVSVVGVLERCALRKMIGCVQTFFCGISTILAADVCVCVWVCAPQQIGPNVLKKKLDVSWERLEAKDQFKTFVEKTGPKGSEAETMTKAKRTVEKHVRGTV